MRWLGTIAAVAALLGSGTAAAAAPAPRYTIIDLGTLGSGDFSVATAVNNLGQVVGYSFPTASTVHAFRWSAGHLTDLGTEPGGGYSRANAINDAGQIAGTADRSAGGFGYPVRWSAAGVLTDLGGPVVNALGVGNGIDPYGQVVGGQRPADSEGSPLGTLYRPDGTRVDLGPAGGVDLGAANGINALGQVVGAPAYIWRSGTVTFLPGFPAGGAGEAVAINNRGVVVGSAPAGDLILAVRWVNGIPTNLGTVDGITRNRATAVNDTGQIVGTADPQCVPCPTPRAWLWSNGVLTPLDGLLPAGSGWTLQQANGINARGQIVGAGLHNGHPHAYLLSPR